MFSKTHPKLTRTYRFTVIGDPTPVKGHLHGTEDTTYGTALLYDIGVTVDKHVARLLLNVNMPMADVIVLETDVARFSTKEPFVDLQHELVIDRDYIIPVLLGYTDLRIITADWPYAALI